MKALESLVHSYVEKHPNEGAQAVQSVQALQYLEEDTREEVLKQLPAAMKHQFFELLQYPPDTTGGMMEPRVTAVLVDLNVQAATDILRKAPRQTLYYPIHTRVHP